LWLALADNSAQDLTVTVAAKHYGASAAASKYTPYIAANGHNLDKETPEFCVGQLVTFSLAFEPEVDYVNLIGQWKIPDKFVNESYKYSSTCVSYRENDGLLVNTNSTGCWFVNGNGGGVSLGVNLKFANGQMVGLAAKGKVNIYRPTFSGFSCWMHTFSYSIPTLVGDMRWSVTVNSKYSGDLGVTQLINGQNPFYPTGGHWYQDGETELYTSQSYNVSPTVTLLDAPSAPTLGLLHMGATFKDYLRFKPETAGSIWVTLGTNGWLLDGVDGTSVLPAASPVVDSDELPVWKDILHE
jgi:hypothetical protein